MIMVGCLLLFLLFVKVLNPCYFCQLALARFWQIFQMLVSTEPGGLLYYVYHVGIESGVFPLLIFMG